MSTSRYLPEYGDDNPCTEPGAYYVSVLDGRRRALALGPFETHPLALAAVGPVRRYCNDRDARAWFYGYGTCRLMPDDPHPAGKLNTAPELAPLVDDDAARCYCAAGGSECGEGERCPA